MTGFAHANDISAAAIARAGETLRLLDPMTAQPAASVAAAPQLDAGTAASPYRNSIRTA